MQLHDYVRNNNEANSCAASKGILYAAVVTRPNATNTQYKHFIIGSDIKTRYPIPPRACNITF